VPGSPHIARDNAAVAQIPKQDLLCRICRFQPHSAEAASVSAIVTGSWPAWDCCFASFWSRGRDLPPQGAAEAALAMSVQRWRSPSPISCLAASRPPGVSAPRWVVVQASETLHTSRPMRRSKLHGRAIRSRRRLAAADCGTV